MASRLAWYRSADLGVLGPRGWTCFGLYGSNGSSLMVTPEDHSKSPLGAKLIGPAIQLSVSIGYTSGRFAAAKIAARLFPGRQAFVDRVVAEGFEPKGAFPSGPYPGDRIRRLDSNAVAFETPAGTDGMGTDTRLVKSSDPIQGLAMMDENNDATLLAVRLGPAMSDLVPFIIAGARDKPKP